MYLLYYFNLKRGNLEKIFKNLHLILKLKKYIPKIIMLININLIKWTGKYVFIFIFDQLNSLREFTNDTIPIQVVVF